MTDRELLELAAKAAGHSMTPQSFVGDYWIKEGRIWNPLNDDGDALRLAVKLNMDIDNTDGEHSQAYCAGKYGTEAFAEDPYAATRRAIVRAAAEIGRGME